MASSPDLVQYILVRTDLKWPKGSLVAQGAHAAMAAAWLHKDDPDTQAYLAALDSMHKVVLGCDSEAALVRVAGAMNAAGVPHKLWVEQPENIPSALASKPGPREVIKPFFVEFKLLR